MSQLRSEKGALFSTGASFAAAHDSWPGLPTAGTSRGSRRGPNVSFRMTDAVAAMFDTWRPRKQTPIEKRGAEKKINNDVI